MRPNRPIVCRLVLLVVAALSPATILRAAEKAEVEYKPDITYAIVAGEVLKLDLATPKSLDHAVPAVVVIHSGGWMSGKRQDMTGFAKEAAARG